MWHWVMSLDQPTRAAVIGGAATMLSVVAGLLGVLANLAWNRKQHRDEKSYSLRRDVYLEAVAVANRAVISLRNRVVPNDVGKDDKQAREEADEQLFGACAKVRLLGEKRAVAAIIAFEAEFDRWTNKLFTEHRLFTETSKRQEDNVNEIKRLGDMVEAFTRDQTESKRLVSEFDPKNTDSQVRQKAIDAANALRKAPDGGAELQKKLDSMRQAVTEATAQLFQQLSSFADYLIKLQEDFVPLLNEIIVAMKSELGLRVHEDWYKNETTEALQQSLRLLQQSTAMKNLRNKIAERVVNESKS